MFFNDIPQDLRTSIENMHLDSQRSDIPLERLTKIFETLADKNGVPLETVKTYYSAYSRYAETEKPIRIELDYNQRYDHMSCTVLFFGDQYVSLETQPVGFVTTRAALLQQYAAERYFPQHQRQPLRNAVLEAVQRAGYLTVSPEEIEALVTTGGPLVFPQ